MKIDKYFKEKCEVCGNPAICFVQDFVEYERYGQLKIDLKNSGKHYFCREHCRDSRIKKIKIGELL
jgi:hypothetical protein